MELGFGSQTKKWHRKTGFGDVKDIGGVQTFGIEGVSDGGRVGGGSRFGINGQFGKNYILQCIRI